MGRTWVEHVVYISCSECQNKNKKQFVYTTCSDSVLSLEFSCTELVIQWTIFWSYCGLVDARISTSEKDLPVPSLLKTFIIVLSHSFSLIIRYK